MEMMPDREKAIKELEWSLKTSCVDETSVIVPQDTVNNVLALLQEHPELMDDLISRKAAMNVFMGMPPDFYHTSYIVSVINCLPSVDAVPVVRCRDCKHCYYASNRVPAEQWWVCGKNWADVKEDWFCADGERGNEDESKS